MLTPEHAELLARAAITPDVIERAGIRSAVEPEDLPDGHTWRGRDVLPAIVFRWREPDGAVTYQLRPDTPVTDADGRPAKYVWPRGGVALLGELVPPVDAASPALIVEGTKQALAAASYAPKGVAVYGIAGCRTWQREGVPTPHLAVVEGRPVLICLDADAADNPEVYDAGLKLAEACRMEGATEVGFVRLAGGKKAGLDDILGRRAASGRAAHLARLLAAAKPKPADTKPRARTGRPAGDASSPYFDREGLLVADLHAAMVKHSPAALTQEGRVAVYRGGVFDMQPMALQSSVVELLGNRFRPGHRTAVEEYTEGILYAAGRRLPVHSEIPMLNCRNGMLDLETGRLKPHDPEYMSTIQFPVDWDEDATCPLYESWLPERAGGQVDDLEEVTSTMLDPSRSPTKAVFLFGPSKSGKSTFLHLMEAMAGTANTSNVTLHALTSNRFMAANLFGKALNVAADLSAAHVEDLSVFKMMTGEDAIMADRKYGGQFPFTNRALFAFSANSLPTVGESSRAYVERVKPFEFPDSFAGSVDRSLRERLVAELPGILVRWVVAWQRLNARGRFLDTDPGVRAEFESRSDRVRQWLSERCTIHATDHRGEPVREESTMAPGDGTGLEQLARAFNVWAEESGGAKMHRNKFRDRLLATPGVVFPVRPEPQRSRVFNITVRIENGPGDFGRLPGDFEPFRATSRATLNDEDGQLTHRVNPARATSGENFSTQGDFGLSASRRDENDLKPLVEGLETCCAPPENFLREVARESPTFSSHAVPTDTFRYIAKVELPTSVYAFDIETAGSENLWTADPEKFIRLAGIQAGNEVRVYTDPREAAGILSSADRIIGHNVMAFDAQAFARLAGWDLHTMTARRQILDTLIVEVLSSPPRFDLKPEQVLRANKLAALAAAKLGAAKGLDLASLARQFGGFDRIPTDHADYVRYCAQDVDLTAQLAAGQRVSEYAWREHRLAAVAGQIRRNGFRVDLDVLASRLQAGRDRRAELVGWLGSVVDLPTVNKAGKPVKSPQATEEGRQALDEALAALGVRLPRTATGGPSMGSESLAEAAREHAGRPDALRLIQAVQALNGVRSVYETVEKYRRDDRCHPEISMVQASGRWSTTKPGLTVFGKRGGRHVEREVFLPEPGHVIVSADLSQVDARAVAAWAQDPAYLGLFEPGRDSHTEIALAVWGDARRRQDAKVVGHGWNYGMGLANLARQCGSEDTAREFDAAMRQRYPGLVAWKRETAERAKSGELLDNGFGRMMRPDPARGWTQGPALMGQGTARDLMMEGLLRLPREVLPMLRAVVHDEIILSVPLDVVDDVERTVLGALSFEWAPPSGGRPVRIEAGLGERRGRNWGDCYVK